MSVNACTDATDVSIEIFKYDVSVLRENRMVDRGGRKRLLELWPQLYHPRPYYMLQCELLCVPTSESGFFQWIWILPVGLDFASGSGLTVGLDLITPWAPCCIMWSTHNHSINYNTHYFSYMFVLFHQYLGLLCNSWHKYRCMSLFYWHIHV